MKHSTELTLIEYCFDHMPECVCATNVPNERATLKCGGPAKAALRHACEIFSAHNCNFSSGQYPKINQNSILSVVIIHMKIYRFANVRSFVERRQYCANI